MLQSKRARAQCFSFFCQGSKKPLASALLATPQTWEIISGIMGRKTTNDATGVSQQKIVNFLDVAVVARMTTPPFLVEPMSVPILNGRHVRALQSAVGVPTVRRFVGS